MIANAASVIAFAAHITQANVEVTFSQQDRPIPGNVVHAVGGPRNIATTRDRNMHRNVKSRSEVVVETFGMPQNKANQQSEHRRRQQR